jgi:hypothetical protein
MRQTLSSLCSKRSAPLEEGNRPDLIGVLPLALRKIQQIGYVAFHHLIKYLGMPKNGDYGQLKRNLELTKFQFVVTELDLAITFCEIALSSEKHDKFQRNTANAKKAYEAAGRFMDQSTLSEEMRLEIADRISTLQQLLKEITDKADGLNVQPG